MSSNGAISMPCRFSTSAVVFQVLADLEDRRVFQQRLERGSASRIGIWLSASPPPSRSPTPFCGRAAHSGRIFVPAGSADCRRSPAKSRQARPASDRARWSRCRRPPGRSRALGIQRSSVAEVADRLIGRMIDRQRREGLAPRLGKLGGRIGACRPRSSPLHAAAPARIRSARRGCRRHQARPAASRSGPARRVTPFDTDDRRLDRAGVAIAGLGHAARQGGEFHRLQEADQLRTVLRFQHQVRRAASVDRHIGAQRHQLREMLRHVGIGEDRLAALGLLDLGGAGQQRFEIAIFARSAGPPSWPDAGNAGHVVD